MKLKKGQIIFSTCNGFGVKQMIFIGENPVMKENYILVERNGTPCTAKKHIIDRFSQNTVEDYIDALRKSTERRVCFLNRFTEEEIEKAMAISPPLPPPPPPKKIVSEDVFFDIEKHKRERNEKSEI